jgi:hypothetical protein
VHIDRPVLDALLAYTSSCGYKTAYDFEGTVIRDSRKGTRKAEQKIVPRASNPKLFISYSWDSETHRRWVLKLAADLIRNGVDVLVDEWNLREFNDDLHRFMETGIRDADFVLLVCTPDYATRTNSRRGGVGVESTIITGEYYNSVKANKFVPITRNAKHGVQQALPSYLKSRLAIDFTDDAVYEIRREELLRRVFNRPRYRRPELGAVPDLSAEDV